MEVQKVTEENCMVMEDIKDNIIVNKTSTLFNVCDICVKEFESTLDLEQHLTIAHRPLTVVDEICQNKVNLKTEKLDCECRICNTIFGTDIEILEHLITVHRPITTNFEDKSNHSFCDTCKNLFKDDFFSHFPCNAVDVKCFFCLTKMPMKGHFMVHNLHWDAFRKFQCNLCEEYTKLMNFTELNEHMKKHNNGLGVFQCLKCKLHMNPTDLEKHYDLCHRGCKCVADLCTCDKYDEYFYIKNILKIDIPFGCLKPRTKYVRSCKTAEKKNICSSPGSSKSSNNIKLENETKDADADKPISNTDDLLDEDSIEKDEVCDEYEPCINVNIKPVRSRKRRAYKRLSKHKLKKLRCQNLIRYHELKKLRKSQPHAELSPEFDTLTSSITDGETSKDESMEISDSENGNSTFFKKDGTSRKTTEKYEAVPNGKHKKIKIRRKKSSKTVVENGTQDQPSLIEAPDCSENQEFLQDFLQVVLDDPDSEHSSISYDQNQSFPPQDDLSECNNGGNELDSEHNRENCQMCEIQFPTSDLFYDHLKTVHQLRDGYIKHSAYCENCKTFKLKTHFPCKKNTGEEICQFCNMGYPKKEHFELHNIEFHSYSEMFCMECNDKVHYKISTLNEHRIKKHNDFGVYECLFCDAKFSTNNKMKEHLVYSNHDFNYDYSAEMYKLHKNYINDLKYTKCEHCDRIFFEERYIKVHRCQQFNCNECSKTFVQQTSLIYHMAIHTKENVFKCSVCDVLFDKQSQLTTHMAIHNEDGTNPHKCDVCSRLFSHRCKLLVHKISHRDDNKDK